MILNFLVDASSIFGRVESPVAAYGSVFTGLVPFLNNILRLIFVIAGLYGFLNLVIAGFGFMAAGGDPKAIEKSWSRIWQSLVGLIIIVGSFLLAAILGYLLFGDATAILQPKVWGPGGAPTGGTPTHSCEPWPLCAVK